MDKYLKNVFGYGQGVKILVLFFISFTLQSCLESGVSEKQVEKQNEKNKSTIGSQTTLALQSSGDIPIDPGPDCLFNGNTVLDGGAVTAYLTSTVGFGATCVSEVRVCRDSTLSGTFSYASCAVDAPMACLFDGQTVSHGSSVTAFTSSVVPYGSSCSEVAQVRTCNNGSLNGNAMYAICKIDEARACLFDGKTVLHNETVQAFQASTTQYGGSCVSEIRKCDNGTLSGNYSFSSCAIDAPASCLFDGQTVVHGAEIVAYKSSKSDFGKICEQEKRLCQNGLLSGSFDFSTCVTEGPANCQFNNKTVIHGQSVIAYISAVVKPGGICASEQRLCENGVLSGAYNFESCKVDEPLPPDPEPPKYKDCTVNGKPVLHGGSITLFNLSKVFAPDTCTSQIRFCQDGKLSGSAQFESCQQIVPVPPEPVDPPPVPVCSLSNIVWDFSSTCSSYCGKGIGFNGSKVSRDGGKTWLSLSKYSLPSDLQEIWKYLLKKHGRNKCNRPNVEYSVSSHNKSFFTMSPKAIPSCEVCKFKEFDIQYGSGNSCPHKKRRETKKVIRFVCEDVK